MSELTSRAAPDDLREQEAELRAQVHQLLEEAARQGADAAEVSVTRSLGLSVTVRRDELETVEFTRDGGFGITVYRGGRQGSASTNVVDADAVADTVERALALAGHTEPDPAAGLADPEELAKTVADLDLHHGWALDVAGAEDLARACERAALGADARIGNSDGATVHSFQAARAYGNSAGFVGSECGTRHGIGVAVVAGEGADMQRDYWSTRSRRPEALEDPEAVGRRAAERTVARLGARPVPTQAVPVLFDAQIAPSILSHFLGAISGGSLYRKASFLCDAIGERLFPERFRIEETPQLPAGIGSAAFDGDGVATRAKAFVEDGVLASYLLSVYSGRRLGLPTTGNCGGVHNLSINDDGLDEAALFSELGTGLLVTELMGQGINLVTGDYSRGAAGYWVENGQIVHPVQEVTVAGTLREMFAGIRCIGGDAEREANVRCGSMLVDGMTVAGS